MINHELKPNEPKPKEQRPPRGRLVSEAEFRRFEPAFPGSKQPEIVIFEGSFQLGPVATIGDALHDALRGWSDYPDSNIHQKISLVIQRARERGIEVGGQTYPVVKIIQTMQNPRYDNSPFILVAKITRII
ncbi:MAG: hypothetical protein M1575_03935 [Patescibacteria group bacterium]|nr:hypothetical protein [Patescibacteria group bacterium]MCL5095843.1 hypothetical protein [Patescibacteria group bacterium]